MCFFLSLLALSYLIEAIPLFFTFFHLLRPPRQLPRLQLEDSRFPRRRGIATLTSLPLSTSSHIRRMKLIQNRNQPPSPKKKILPVIVAFVNNTSTPFSVTQTLVLPFFFSPFSCRVRVFALLSSPFFTLFFSLIV